MTVIARPWIRPLPPRLVNKIAAGEVVERPASVVKEIVENALDAGATAISIVIEKSGMRSIRVTDNGVGIPVEQLEVAFARHATSKISSLDDLDEIGSYGFRGEALPAIASVSHTMMISRPHDQAVATEIVYEGGVLTHTRATTSLPGTSVEVANLFFNTPARKKFLKSENVEYRTILRVVTAMALARPDVSFRFQHDDRLLFDSPSGTFRERVQSVMGSHAVAVNLSDEEGPLAVEGFLATADKAVRDRHQLFLILNGRWIQSQTLAHGIVIGFGELLPRGMQPVGALHLKVEKREVDVNIHPAKTEVRLAKEREIHDALYQIVKRAVRSSGSIPDFHPSGNQFDLRSQSSNVSSSRRPSFSQGDHSSHRENHASYPSSTGKNQNPRVNIADLLYGDSSSSLPDTTHHSNQTSENHPSQKSVEHMQIDLGTGEVIESPTNGERTATPFQSDDLRYLGKLRNLYLLFEHGYELLIVDQHTAHERVLFEEVLARMEREGVLAQQLLLPSQVELTHDQLAVFEEAQPILRQGGFIASPFGGKTILIEAVPAILRRFSPEVALLKILDDITTLRASGYDVRKASAQSIACRSAVMRGDRLSDDEARSLVSQLLKCQNPFSCPHGRPTFVRIRGQELDHQFGRG